MTRKEDSVASIHKLAVSDGDKRLRREFDDILNMSDIPIDTGLPY